MQTKEMGNCQILPDDASGDCRCCWIAKEIVDLQSRAIDDNEESNSNEISTFITIEEDEVTVSLGEIESHNETADNTSKTSEASISMHISLVVGYMCLSIIFI